MSEDREGLTTPDFKVYSLENLGQVIKASVFLEPEVFPYHVLVRKDSPFFRSVYDGVYLGRGVIVGAPADSKRRILRGSIIEHDALLAVNDAGELMISNEIYEGNFFTSLTKYSKDKLQEHERIYRSIGLPQGWRRIGSIHSHPFVDVMNTAGLALSKTPKVGKMPVTWSSGDFKSVVIPVIKGYEKANTLGVITPVQLAFITTTAKTLRLSGKKDKETDELLKTKSDLPPYKNFEKLGLVMYAGNYRKKDGFILERLS